jgi:peptidoglycan/LPS O-acetylase OafA/YrhL
VAPSMMGDPPERDTVFSRRKVRRLLPILMVLIVVAAIVVLLIYRSLPF